MEHIKLTKEGFTHWSSGPGNPTFDPQCGACWQAEAKRLRSELQDAHKLYEVKAEEIIKRRGLETEVGLLQAERVTVEQAQTEMHQERLKYQASIATLTEALVQHRADLHGSSTRPCATCRKSAIALGIKVPDACAERNTDKKALATKEEE